MTLPTSSRPDGVVPFELGSGVSPSLPRAAIDAVLLPALDEDGMPPAWAGAGDTLGRDLPGRAGSTVRRVDLTSDIAIPESVQAQARLVAKAGGLVCGLCVFERALQVCDPLSQIEVHARDGQRVVPGEVVLSVRGKARALLFAERTGLNFVQRLSGVASLTARYVALCAGRARVLDTRKTTPNLRVLEKYAVRCGGGTNHRFGLYDEAMVKNNHADLAGVGLGELVRRLRAGLGEHVRITSEARDSAEALAGVAGDADVILLDNFSVAELAAVVPQLRERARGRPRPLELEASGGITEHNVAAVAGTGVDRISVGALTHSAPALDFSFYLRPV